PRRRRHSQPRSRAPRPASPARSLRAARHPRGPRGATPGDGAGGGGWPGPGLPARGSLRRGLRARRVEPARQGFPFRPPARDLLHKESHQFVDIVEAFRPFTKWNARVETGSVIPEVIRKAFKIAQEEKPGACHVELPEDVAQEAAEGAPLRTERARRPSPDRPSLARAADIVNDAARPLILAGNGVIRGHAAAELRALAERAGIPVVTTF